jgi:serine/threonine protein kinase
MSGVNITHSSKLRKVICDKAREYNKEVPSESTLDFLEQFLKTNPKLRISASEALNHSFFKEEPLACLPSELPKIEGELHEMAVKKH